MDGGNGQLTIAVLVKQVPDMNAVKIDRASGAPQFGGQQVVSSYDEYAVELALRLAERHGGATVVLTVGPASARDALTRALAMGVDRAVHIETADPNGLGTLAVARLLAGELGKISPSLVIAGQTADDFESGQVGGQVAELLDLPLISNIVSVDASGGHLTLRRDMEDGYQTVTVAMPALLLSSTGLDEPRLPSLKGIMAAKKKPVDVVAASVPGESDIRWTAPKAPEKSVTGVLLQDVPAAEAARRLTEWLKEQKAM
ncbi:MAG: electron transfer flavoprotein subunit beta/FixA family protein [Chloroflexota bacterium]